MVPPEVHGAPPLPHSEHHYLNKLWHQWTYKWQGRLKDIHRCGKNTRSPSVGPRCVWEFILTARGHRVLLLCCIAGKMFVKMDPEMVDYAHSCLPCYQADVVCVCVRVCASARNSTDLPHYSMGLHSLGLKRYPKKMPASMPDLSFLLPDPSVLKHNHILNTRPSAATQRDVFVFLIITCKKGKSSFTPGIQTLICSTVRGVQDWSKLCSQSCRESAVHALHSNKNLSWFSLKLLPPLAFLKIMFSLKLMAATHAVDSLRQLYPTCSTQRCHSRAIQTLFSILWYFFLYTQSIRWVSCYSITSHEWQERYQLNGFPCDCLNFLIISMSKSFSPGDDTKRSPIIYFWSASALLVLKNPTFPA